MGLTNIKHRIYGGLGRIGVPLLILALFTWGLPRTAEAHHHYGYGYGFSDHRYGYTPTPLDEVAKVARLAGLGALDLKNVKPKKTAVVPSAPHATTSDAALPELSRAEMENFLLTAKIVKQRSLSIGITGSERATLTDGRLTHDAHIQTVDVWKASYTTLQGTEFNFRDSYKYNIAAYRLDKLLDLRMVPVSVERKVGGKTAAVTWWVDDVQMMERKRYLKKIEPPNKARWNDQMYQVRAFNALIYNTDPNLGNALITKDWKLWMVDFTRAFRTHKKLRNPKNLRRIDRRFYNGLGALTEDILTQELRLLLTNPEVKGLLARRDLLLEFFHREIAKRGEGAVICGMPGH